MSVLEKVRDMFRNSNGSAATIDETKAASFELTVKQPAADADTCQIHLHTDIFPEATMLIETVAEAEGWPVIQSLMRIGGIHSVIIKGRVMILSKHPGASWANILGPAEATIRQELDPDAAHSPVDAHNLR